MPDAIADLVVSFQRSLRAEMRSPLTIKTHLMAPRFFSDWLIANGSTATVDNLDRDHIVKWLVHLGVSCEMSTVKTRFAGLRRFCNWLVAEDELDTSPMAGLTAPDPPMKPVPILDDDALTALLKACAGKTFEDRRDEALFRVLLDAGVRASELCGMTVTSVDLGREMAIVVGKGGKVRAVYFGTRTVRALDRYQRERKRHRWAHLDAFWLSQRGAMSGGGVRERLRVRAAQAGVGDRVHPHRFRHTFAHDFLVNGGQERDLKRLAGWSSDAMLERYGASAADMRAREATRRMRRGDRV